MLNTPQFNSASIHQRFSRHLSAIAGERRKPALQIQAGSSRLDASIIEAVGYDIQIATKESLNLRQGVVVVFQSEAAVIDVAIPGIVHWVNSRIDWVESALVLQEAIPDDLIVRPRGFVQRGIRFACNVQGTLSWDWSGGQFADDGRVSIPAIATNYSGGGFCVQLTAEPAIGAEVAFRWQSGRSRHQLKGIVRWVIGQSSGGLAGCEIIDGRGYLLGGVEI